MADDATPIYEGVQLRAGVSREQARPTSEPEIVDANPEQT